MKGYKSVLVFSLVILLLSSCANKVKFDRILWPPKPKSPILEFIAIYASTNDFDRTELEKAVEILFDDEATFFKLPFGITSDKEELLFVTDQEGIKALDIKKRKSSLYLSRKEIAQPSGITAADNGNIFVVDSKMQRVVVLSPEKKIISTLGSSKIFEKPSFVCLDRISGHVYVSDMLKHRIAVFDKKGDLVNFIGKPGKGDGEFAFPQGMALSADNKLYVADMLNSRIQVFTAEGKFLRSFGQAGSDHKYFESPRDLAFGPDGNLYIVDFKKALLLTYTPDGTMLLATGNPKKTNHPLGFAAPASIHINKEGRIYITDMMNHRVSVWQIITDDYLRKNPIN